MVTPSKVGYPLVTAGTPRPSTFSLTRRALKREVERCCADGWQQWEIATRFADPDEQWPRWECPGQFGPGGQWMPCCRGDAA
jgi:hypothetical protein